MKMLLNSHIMFAIHMVIVAVVIAIAACTVHAASQDVRTQL